MGERRRHECTITGKCNWRVAVIVPWLWWCGSMLAWLAEKSKKYANRFLFSYKRWDEFGGKHVMMQLNYFLYSLAWAICIARDDSALTGHIKRHGDGFIPRWQATKKPLLKPTKLFELLMNNYFVFEFVVCSNFAWTRKYKNIVFSILTFEFCLNCYLTLFFYCWVWQ